MNKFVHNKRLSEQVKHRTIANISGCSVQEINAIKFALKHKNELVDIISNSGSALKQGKSIGSVWLNETVNEDHLYSN